MSQIRSLSAILTVASIVGAMALGNSPAAGADPESENSRAADLITPAVVYLQVTAKGVVVDANHQVLGNGAPQQQTFQCTGFAITSDGYIATAGHCVDPDEYRKAIVVSAAEQLSGGASVTRDDLERLGANAWAVEGNTPGAGPDQEIVVSGAGQRGDVKPIPARVVGFRPLGQGDVALLKVELNGQVIPTAQVALDSSPQVGDPVLAVGYPASTTKVTDFSLNPTVKSGTVSAKQTWNTQPVFQVSAPMTKGMSGGPTVDMQGRVIGINSYMPTNEEQPFNFISPASGLKELLGQAGVSPTLSAADKAYRQGLDNMNAGKYTDAISNFDTALALSHQYPGVLDKRTEAVKLRAERGDASSGPKPWLMVVAGLGVVMVIAGGVLAFVLLRRNRQPALAGAGQWAPQQSAPAPSPQAPINRPAAPNPPAGAPPAAPTSGGSQSNCKNCGFGMETGVKFCPRCGKPQS
jgi:serine protease Do